MNRKTIRILAAAGVAVCLLASCNRGQTTPVDTSGTESSAATTGTSSTSTGKTSGSTAGRTTTSKNKTTATASRTTARTAKTNARTTAGTTAKATTRATTTTDAPGTTAKVTTTTVRTTTTRSTSTTQPTQPDLPKQKLELIADRAYEDMMLNFWYGDPASGHMVKSFHGYTIDESERHEMMWDHGTLVFALDSYYQLTQDPEISDRIVAQWEFVKGNFTEEQLTGNFGEAPNIAVDDTGWDAMALMIYYRYSEDEYALETAGQLILNAYDYWMDEDTANGLWYPSYPPSQGNDDPNYRWKSLYSVGLLTASFDYYDVTGDQVVFDKMMDVYNWIEANLRRSGQDWGYSAVNDGLYYADFNDERLGRDEYYGPDGSIRPFDIREAGSVSYLGGNMGMAALNARLYYETNDDLYLRRAVETIHALTDSDQYNNNGAYVNDRDAWANGAFCCDWVNYAMTLPGVRELDKSMLYNTAFTIWNNARTSEGYYSGSWTGSGKWERVGSNPEQIMTSATSVNFIMGAALLEASESGK